MGRPMMANAAGASGRATHDHGACVDTLLDRAQQSFDEKGLKLTALRLRVLEEIAASHDAVGAYDLLERLASRTGERLAPISVYRAIDALRAAGLVHRLESRNAFFACHAPHKGLQRHMALVCETCATVTEVPAASLYEAIETSSQAVGFVVTSAIAEGLGICASCSARADKASNEAHR